MSMRFTCVWACMAIGAQLTSPRAVMAAPAASCQSADIYGKAWVAAPNGADASSAQAWIWPGGDDPRRLAWRAVPAQTCLSLPADAGAIVYTPAVVQALGQGSGGSFLRQMMFRLGLERLGDARIQMQQPAPGRFESHGSVAWPAPHRGPLTALGTAQTVQRPGAVPADALGFAVASVSAGRAWQQLEAFAGGLWPLEATLVGTQISAWEQGAGHGELAGDILGYTSTPWTAVLLPGSRGPSLAFMLPVAKPEIALGFVAWAVEVVSGFAPSLGARREKVLGQSMLAVRGLWRTPAAMQQPVYMTASKDALFASADPASLLALQKAADLHGAFAPLDEDAPKSAVAFGQVDNAALLKRLGGRYKNNSAWLRALHLDVPGQSFGFLDTTPDAMLFRTLQRATSKECG